MGIIGVVAAMTMPVLITKHQEKVFAVKIKKTFSNIQNAFLAVQNNYDTIGDNSVLFGSNATSMAQEFSTYFNGAKFCKQLDTSCPETNYTIKPATEIYNASGLFTFKPTIAPSIILTDGTIMSIREYSEGCDKYRTDSSYDKDGNLVSSVLNHITYCAAISVDVNGSKPPNIYGRDNFYIFVYKNKVSPSFYEPYGGATLKTIFSSQ